MGDVFPFERWGIFQPAMLGFQHHPNGGLTLGFRKTIRNVHSEWNIAFINDIFKGQDGRVLHLPHGGFLKWWCPTTIGFPTKNDHEMGCEMGTHHLRNPPNGDQNQIFPSKQEWHRGQLLDGLRIPRVLERIFNGFFQGSNGRSKPMGCLGYIRDVGDYTKGI